MISYDKLIILHVDWHSWHSTTLSLVSVDSAVLAMSGASCTGSASVVNYSTAHCDVDGRIRGALSKLD